MRLQSIKLSGFKSFADATQFVLPGQLVGVVGPNGCGKSNIMDAVRWVLGESRASELRGESMQDVIFNGTTSRKSAQRASVELVFDNASQRAGGQWSQFAEVAVKRVLTRDGTSSYYINNQPVRRRDVQDVFLGTGLGPRAYAIIGQGTISRIIESKPEELRLFLEEAAGVSKYKERRRETEARLSDTQENLTRVEDILRELTANLDKLEKQAEVASRYHALHADLTLKQQQQWFLKREQAQQEAARCQAEGQQALLQLEARVAELRHIEADLQAQRQQHYASGDQVNQLQGLLYQASAEVGRIEAEIRFVVEGRQRVEQGLAQLKTQQQQWAQRQTQASADLAALADQTQLAQATAAERGAGAAAHTGELPALQDALRAAQAQAGQQRVAVGQVQQKIQVLAAEQRYLGEQLRQLQTRRERLVSDQSQLSVPDDAHLAVLQQQWAAAQAAQTVADGAVNEAQEALPLRDAERRALQQTANTEAAKRADLSARLEALKALQDKVKVGGKLQPWLARHGLQDMAALWSKIHVEPGWENALEAALRERLGALEVSQLERVQAFAKDAPPAKLVFYSLPSAGAAAPAAGALPLLSTRLRLHDAGQQALLADWLTGCLCAPTLEAAQSARGELHPGEVIYVPSGHAVTRHSVSFYAPDSEQAGLLARAQEIENLEKQCRAQSLMADESRTALLRAEAAYQEASQRLALLRKDAQQAQNAAHAQQVHVLKLTQQAAQSRDRASQIDRDLGELDTQGSALQNRQGAAQTQFEALDADLGQAQEQHAALDDAALAAERALHAAQQAQRLLEQQAQEAQFALRSLLARRSELERGAVMAAQQLHNLAAESALAEAELARLGTASAQAGLQDALALKSERESALAASRSQYDDLSAKLRASDERRLQLERELDPLRQRQTDWQMKEQAAQLGAAQLAESLLQAKADEALVAASLQQGSVKLGALGPEIERLQAALEALGAVNLAALDELTTARERKQFLDAQNADLVAAMTTLQDAIRKIDHETRDLLGHTFEKVNTHFGKMFPELFGGGQASLVMTGAEILDSGVQVLAQPPGKKNQSIALLSGGEKALTAIALVFAIFQLNPAPFCLLDEVDAPLDDANTERYAKLVTRMSQETQFLFISHNKIAMEMAQQLIGVTMQEQGVSRIVAVDMEFALSSLATSPTARQSAEATQ
ncbi:MAG: chromosome segregation protein SMC [Burkholderiaceae bacterium]